MQKRFVTIAWTALLLILALQGPASARLRLLGTRLVTPEGEILFSFEKNKVFIGKIPYLVKRWGEDRLKLTREGASQGVFLKRFGVKLMIRDLSGNLLHIIRKEGDVFRVESPIGAHLIFLKVSPKAVTLFKKEGTPLYTITSKRNSVLMKDAKGKLLYTLKGDTAIYPAGFLCLPVLTAEERAACYLLYKGIPLSE